MESREQSIYGHVLDHKQRENLWFKYAGEADHQKSGEENINKIFSGQIKEAQYRIYTEKKGELAQNLEDILYYLEDGKLVTRTEKEIQKINESIEKLYEKGYNKDSAKELVGYLKGNLDRLVESKKS